MKCIVGASIPNNAGTLDAIRVTAPENSIVHALHPAAVNARSTIGHMLPDVVYGALHQCIPGRVPAEGSLRVVGLGSEPRVAAASRGHALARRRRLHWAELAEHPLVVNAASGTVDPSLWPAGARPEVAVRCRTYDEWIEMVAAARGVGVLPASARERPHPGVRYVSLVDAPEVELVLVRPSRGAHPLAEATRAMRPAWRRVTPTPQ